MPDFEQAKEFLEKEHDQAKELKMERRLERGLERALDLLRKPRTTKNVGFGF